MDELSLGKMLLIFGLVLVVLGPQKLPHVAAQVGLWVGRARGMAKQFRMQLEQEANRMDQPVERRPPAAAPVASVAAVAPPVLPYTPYVAAAPEPASDPGHDGPESHPQVETASSREQRGA